jgi:hypothetical protein
MAIGLITYQDTSRREDLADIVTNISPKETPLLSGLPSGRTATQTLHEFAQDAFAAYSDNAQAEGSDFSAVDLVAPTRDNNITQIFKKQVRVSGTEAEVNGVVDAWNYQLNKNMTELSKDIELAYMAGSRASGSSGVARRLQGVINALTSNATTRASGSSLGEVAFNDIMQMIWGNTGVVATEVYVGAALKRDISGFTAGSTKFARIDDGDKRLVNSVDVYESDFGIHKIFKHRNVPVGANALTLVAINPEYHKKSWLTGRSPKMEDIAKTGDHRSAELIAEGTLEHTAKGGADGAAVGGFTL